MSHLEFGSCLADYPGMMNRYSKVRALEDVDEFAGRSNSVNQNWNSRRRFINYYTASTGRPKKPKDSTSEESINSNTTASEAGMSNLSLGNSEPQLPRSAENATPTGNDVDLAGGIHMKQVEEQMQELGDNSGVQDEAPQSPEMQHIDSIPIEDDEIEPISNLSNAKESDNPTQKAPTELPLPPIPDAPTEPQPIDLDLYTDKDSRKIAEKEHKRSMKAYNQALKDRESALKDRRKLVEKREKKARQEEEKQLKAQEKQRLKEVKEAEKRQTTSNPKSPKGKDNSQKTEKPKKDKKFCMLPPESGGKQDVCWVRVYMEGVDEVGAHCGLFFPGPQYESLVGNVGERIETWVKEDATARAVLSR
ncbi:hypothetical protein EYC84_003124 [Monilinia fructicola]|uniref:Uncharacterized protein n=1 Tax=Monilinia fructicola TaxID=38448 RepID=A0A5M9JSN2_MONFR|nr:hypothetical protein EYC84_003124 [Monilinia fructicola]